MSVATIRVLSQSDWITFVEDNEVICLSISHVTKPKLVTSSIFLKQFPCEEKLLFVSVEPNKMIDISSLLSENN